MDIALNSSTHNYHPPRERIREERQRDKERKGRKKLRARLIHRNDYYMGKEIGITRNTLSWNVISITIH